MKRTVFFIVLVGLLSVAASAKEREVKHGKIVNQSLDYQDRGAAAVPLNGMIVAVPIRGFSNVVTLEFETTVFTLSEIGKQPIVFIVGRAVDFYFDGNHVFFLDSGGKKHKFAVTHMEQKS